MRPRILVLSGVRAGTEFPLPVTAFSIGRNPEADLFLSDRMVSRPHCTITFVDGRHYIEDRRSQNGTIVNAEQITAKRALEHGDRISIGDTTITFLIEESSVVADAPVYLIDSVPVPTPKMIALERKSGVFDSALGVAKTMGSPTADFREELFYRIFSSSPADHAALLFLGADGVTIVSRWARDRRDPARHVVISNTVLSRVLTDGAMLITNDLEASGIGITPSLREGEVEAIICIPMEASGRRIGLIYADSSDPNAVFDKTHGDGLMIIGTMGGMSFEYASLVERLQIENAQLKEDLDIGSDLIGSSAVMAEVAKFISKAGPSGSTVVIQGESGTGKDLVARALHRCSDRSDGPFISVNCAALPEHLVESELFGYEKGAFTGATTAKPGKFELAKGGTLFLDEIGEFPLPFQAKLLRALQAEEIDRLGGIRPVKTDARIIVATNRDLEDAVAKGQFRQDLYYRLNVLAIRVPPLRERRQDIVLLAEHFLAKYSRKRKRWVRGIAEEARTMLENCRWPGNVRELENLIERVVVMGSSDVVLPEDLPEVLRRPSSNPTSAAQKERDNKREIYRQAIIECDGIASKAAQKLGRNEKSFYRTVDTLGLSHLLKRPQA
jgi:transcriptional regulator with GAF, ATPase, and Fis domain